MKLSPGIDFEFNLLILEQIYTTPSDYTLSDINLIILYSIVLHIGRQKVVPMEKLIVPRLRDIAFKVSYKEILNSLVLCRDHRPEEKQLKWVASSSFLSLNQFCTSQFLISLMRNRLDQFPIEVKINAEMRCSSEEIFIWKT